MASARSGIGVVVLIPDLGQRLDLRYLEDDALGRLNWPGNVAQLRGVLLNVLQHRRSGVMELSDLPPECHTTSRRVLSPIEALERDAIVDGLRHGTESPTEAAKQLGMSRATIYRKIRQYDITLTGNR